MKRRVERARGKSDLILHTVRVKHCDYIERQVKNEKFEEVQRLEAINSAASLHLPLPILLKQQHYVYSFRTIAPRTRIIYLLIVQKAYSKYMKLIGNIQTIIRFQYELTPRL